MEEARQPQRNNTATLWFVIKVSKKVITRHCTVSGRQINASQFATSHPARVVHSITPETRFLRDLSPRCGHHLGISVRSQPHDAQVVEVLRSDDPKLKEQQPTPNRPPGVRPCFHVHPGCGGPNRVIPRTHRRDRYLPRHDADAQHPAHPFGATSNRRYSLDSPRLLSFHVKRWTAQQETQEHPNTEQDVGCGETYQQN